MNDEYGISTINKVRQLPKKAHYDDATVHAILDAGLVAHVAFAQDGAPVVVPMIYGRVGRTLYLHGARKARVIRLLEKTDRACINVTLVDGIVLARSAFNSSMHYRSATVFGAPQLVDDPGAKLEALRVISEHSMPGRWDELRAPHEREVKMTGVIRLDIDAASAKLSNAMPDDEEEDYDIPVWAGVLPLTSTFKELLGDDRVLEGVEPSAVVKRLQGRTL
jgi:nitroimidazol reductase NimA-like FMN-containing flavoprotein (pyridoxamine 5'-phosphate oxidase superfamily)